MSVFAEALQQFVHSTRAASLYQGAFPGKVQTQNTDGTVDVQPDDARLPSMQRVPVRWGTTGVVVKLGSGARAVVQFENGDPSSPIVTNWEAAGCDEVRLGATSEAGTEVTEKAVTGTAYRAAEKQLHNDVAAQLTAAAAQCTALQVVFDALSAIGIPPAVGVAFTAMGTALSQAASQLTSFESTAAGQADYLSTRVRVK